MSDPQASGMGDLERWIQGVLVAEGLGDGALEVELEHALRHARSKAARAIIAGHLQAGVPADPSALLDAMTDTERELLESLHDDGKA